LPQNDPAALDQASCNCESPSSEFDASNLTPPTSENTDFIIQSPAQPQFESEPPNEIESVPEVNPAIPVDTDTTSRLSRPDNSIAQTISQLQPPTAEFAEMQPAVVAAPIAEDPIAKDISKTDESLESPYYEPTVPKLEPAETLVVEAPKKSILESPIVESKKLETPPAARTADAGKAFDRLANDIFENINLEESILQDPAPIPSEPTPNTVPAKPVSIEIEQEPEPVAPQEEVFGAIQFDAVLKRAAKNGLYARQDDERLRNKKRNVSNFTPSNNSASEDVDFMIRPLPKLVERKVAETTAPAPESYEFRTMPAYHMPTLRAIPQTRERETQSSLFKFQMDGSQIAKPIRQPLPPVREAKSNQTVIKTFSPLPPLKSNASLKPLTALEEDLIFEPIPVDSNTTSPVTQGNEVEAEKEEVEFKLLPTEPKPLITPLPQLPGSPATDDETAPQLDLDSTRRLTQKTEDQNPLR
jgi:hypothetical protein